MMNRYSVLSAVGAFALSLIAGSASMAQTKSKTPAPPAPTTGAFEKLSPGNQKVASALYQAQNTGTTPPTTTLTLDEIAARKQSGQGWGQIFNNMKAQGLVQEKNLGQTVSKYNQSTHGTVTNASGRVVAGPGSSGKAQGAVQGTPGGGRGASVGGDSSGNSSGTGNAYGAGSNNSGGGVAHGSGKGGK